MTLFSVVYTVLSVIAGGSAVIMNVAPLVAIRELERAESIGTSTITFFAAQLLNGVVWSAYGGLNSNYPLLTANVLGNAVATYCMLVFLSVARREERRGVKLPSTTYTKSLLTLILFAVLSAAFAIVDLTLVFKGDVETAVLFTGYVGTTTGIVMLASPLMLFSTIIKEKDASSLQPIMIAFAFGNTVCWVIAGAMVGDFFIVVANGLPLMAVCAQIVLLVKYGRHSDAHERKQETAIAALPFD